MNPVLADRLHAVFARARKSDPQTFSEIRAL